MLFPIHAEQAGRQTALSRILWASNGKELRMKPVCPAQDLSIESGPERKDKLLVTFLQRNEIPGFTLDSTHAGYRVVREITQSPGDRRECLSCWLESGHGRPGV